MLFVFEWGQVRRVDDSGGVHRIHVIKEAAVSTVEREIKGEIKGDIKEDDRGRPSHFFSFFEFAFAICIACPVRRPGRKKRKKGGRLLCQVLDGSLQLQ